MRVNINDRSGAENLILDGWRQVETMENWVGQRPDDYEEQVAAASPSIFTVEEASDDHAAAVSMLPINPYNRLFREPNMDPQDADFIRRAFMVKSIEGDESYVALSPDDDVVGYMSIDALKGPEDDFNYGQIKFIVVDQGFRRMGIGALLVMKAFEKHKFVLAGTQSRNHGAKKFYEAHGFSCTAFFRTFHKW